MSKRTFMTNITALPPTVSRDVVIAVLHDHHSMIKLNPLVLRHQDTHPPPNASRDEKDRAVWYEITDKISYLPGGAMTGEVSYKACFYNLPTGLQTHVFAPAGVDIRSKWSVGGNMPGEPREPAELGLNVPRDVLYIKEEVDLRCNLFMSNFVRRNLKKSHAVVADKIVAKADEIGPPPMSRPGLVRESAALPSMPVDRILTRETSITRSSFDSDVLDSPGPIHYSYPPHCACEGTSHNQSCTFYGQADVYKAVAQHKQKPFYAISLPSDSSLALASPSAAASPDPAAPTPELYGSLRRNTCFCTGALHDVGCPSYPGLRLAQPKVSLSNDDAAHSAATDDEVQSAVSPIQSEACEMPRLRYSTQDIKQLLTLQKTGESDNVPATRSSHDQEWCDRDLMPSPLQTRANG